MLKLSKRYNKLYTANVFKLNKCALKIQHWYFKSKQIQQKQEKPATEFKVEAVEETKEEAQLTIVKEKSVPSEVLEPILKEFKEEKVVLVAVGKPSQAREQDKNEKQSKDKKPPVPKSAIKNNVQADVQSGISQMFNTFDSSSNGQKSAVASVTSEIP